MKIFVLSLLLLLSHLAFGQQKQLAITVDDLPFARHTQFSKEHQLAMNSQFLNALMKHHAIAIGFVNEGKMYQQKQLNDTCVQILKMWLECGMELGNHTRDHIDYNRKPISEFSKNILDGEIVTNQLLATSGKQVVYFRHPYLHRGNSAEKVDTLEKYLASIKHIEAPVTIDNSDWIFSLAYDSLLKTRDTLLQKALIKEYIHYMEEKIVFYELQCDTLFHKPINQILLLHINSLNAACLDELLTMYENNGYRFVTMEEALKDDIYASEDHYYKGSGISWIHRWAITQNQPSSIFKGEPKTPDNILKLAKIAEE